MGSQFTTILSDNLKGLRLGIEKEIAIIEEEIAIEEESRDIEELNETLGKINNTPTTDEEQTLQTKRKEIELRILRRRRINEFERYLRDKAHVLSTGQYLLELIEICAAKESQGVGYQSILEYGVNVVDDSMQEDLKKYCQQMLNSPEVFRKLFQPYNIDFDLFEEYLRHIINTAP